MKPDTPPDNPRVNDGWQELAGRREEFDSGAGPRVSARHRCVVRPGVGCAARCRRLCAVELCRRARSQHDLGAATRWHRGRFLPGVGRLVGADGVAPDQAFATPAQRLRQLRPEQSQPGRGDDRRRSTDHLLQRPLPRNLRPGAFRYQARHDRAGTAGGAAHARCAGCQRRCILRPGHHPGWSDHRTAQRQIDSGEIFPPAERRLGRDP